MSGREVTVTDEMVERARAAYRDAAAGGRWDGVMRTVLEAALNPTPPKPKHHPMLIAAAKAMWDARRLPDSWDAMGGAFQEKWIKSFAAGLRALRTSNGEPWVMRDGRRLYYGGWNYTIDDLTGDA